MSSPKQTSAFKLRLKLFLYYNFFPSCSCGLVSSLCKACVVSFGDLLPPCGQCLLASGVKKKKEVILFSASHRFSCGVFFTGSFNIKLIDLSWKQHPVTPFGLVFSAGGLNGSGLFTNLTGSLLLSRVGSLSVLYCEWLHLVGQLECDTYIWKLRSVVY